MIFDMDELTIKTILTNDKFVNLNGVFPKDIKPDGKKRVGFYIINTGLSTTVGEHWVALYTTPTKTIYFDSFGRTPKVFPLIFDLCKKLSFTKNIIYNNTQIQNKKMGTCGHYVLLFCLILARNHVFQKFLGFFDTNYTQNDRNVCYIIRKLYPGTVKISCF
jgi:hypothetical protein